MLPRRAIPAWFTLCALHLSLALPAFAQAPAAAPVAEKSEPTEAAALALFPRELVEWRAAPENPVFVNGGPGAWDERIRERGWILKEGNRYTLWYTGYTNSKESLRMLGRAVSDDGLHWKRDPAGPLDREHWIEDVMVVKQDGRYLIAAEGVNDVAHTLTSKDGIHWTLQGPLDIRRKSGEPIALGPRGTPVLYREKGIDYLFYERSDTGVWLATSRDGKVFTNVDDDPVLPKGPGAYDGHAVAMNQVIKYRGRYYAFYHGSDTEDWKEWSMSIATSDDLIHWTKYPKNPLLRDNKSSGIVVHDGTRWRLYTMHGTVQLHYSAVESSPAE